MVLWKANCLNSFSILNMCPSLTIELKPRVLSICLSNIGVALWIWKKGPLKTWEVWSWSTENTAVLRLMLFPSSFVSWISLVILYNSGTSRKQFKNNTFLANFLVSLFRFQYSSLDMLKKKKVSPISWYTFFIFNMAK